MTVFNTQEFLNRYKDRADAVAKRGIPPVGGEERNAFIEQAELDFMDFSLIASSEIDVTDDAIILRIKL